jgi:hypothetical protein
MGVPPYAVAKEDDVLRFLSSWPLRSLQRLVSSGERPSVLVLTKLRRLQGETGSQEVRALLSQVRVVPAREASGEEAVYVIPVEALGTVEPLAERLEDCAYLLHLEPEEVQAALSASSATDRSSP